MFRCFKKTGSNGHISAWKSIGLSDESIEPPATSNNSLAPVLNYVGNKTREKFNVSCLKEGKVTFTLFMK